MNKLIFDNERCILHSAVKLFLSEENIEPHVTTPYLKTGSFADYRKDVQTFINAGPQELAIILSGGGLYTAALKLLTGFGLSPLLIWVRHITKEAPMKHERGHRKVKWLICFIAIKQPIWPDHCYKNSFMILS
ncbi:uncharacterized protein LOC129250639 [Anastrepha obliqua]|uniref:uncharacterized protein LOC129250635 n=1 Tax=Anastrepha obliqua TaxID=95512 RepID=UPI0024091A8C|nr:uncharacterized protein LOC129250635 [Anastrepha obliqua]XP_054746221.1 uncharacterized protein LOC129250639 [Anastrepha obliqua]